MLDGGSAEKAAILVFIYDSAKGIGRTDFRGRLVAVPLPVLPQPENTPDLARTHVRCLRDTALHFLARGAPPDRTNFEYFDALTGDAVDAMTTRALGQAR